MPLNPRFVVKAVLITVFLAVIASRMVQLMEDESDRLLESLLRELERYADDDDVGGGGGGVGRIDPALVDRPAASARQRVAPSTDPDLADILAAAALRGDVSVVRAMLTLPTLDVNTDLGQGRGSVLAVMAGQPETAATVELVKMILRHPKVNVNGGAAAAWSPLKTALHAGNRRVVAAILSHPTVDTQVHADGLPCAVLRDVPTRIVFVTTKASPLCFRKHRGSVDENDDARLVREADVTAEDVQALERLKRLAKATAARQEGGAARAGLAGEHQHQQRGRRAAAPPVPSGNRGAAATATGASSGVDMGTGLPGMGGGKQRKRAREIPAPLVVNPEEGFTSFADVATYYAFARWGPYSTLVFALAAIWVLLAGSATFFAAGASARWKREEAEERAAMAAQLTPPPPPVADPEPPLPEEEAPAADHDANIPAE